MTWQTGTASNYVDLLDQLRQIASSNNCSSASVSAGGTGYVVGEILTDASVDGTQTHRAIFEVTAESAGVVTAVVIKEGGAYTVNPATPIITTSDLSGTGCTLTVSFTSTGWTVLRETVEAASATIAAGGTGYSVSDKITLVGGLGVGTAAIFNVDTESAGVVTAVSVSTPGDYEEVPADPVATTGGGGTGCTLNVTYVSAAITNDKVLILDGIGGGSDNILVGIKTYTEQPSFDIGHNWGLVGITGFNPGLVFHQQAGISPGFDFSTGDSETTGGAFVTLQNDVGGTFPMDFWFSITSRRIIGVAKVENASDTIYASLHLGFMNQAGTATEFPYPIYIAGCTSRNDSLFDDAVDGRITGLTEAIQILNKPGPAFYLREDSVWTAVANSRLIDTGTISRTSLVDYTVYPVGIGDHKGDIATEDEVVQDGQGITWDDIAPTDGVPGVADFQLQQTPQAGGDEFLLIPATVVASEGTHHEILGELDAVFWFGDTGTVSSEDTHTIGADVYRVFQNGNRTEDYSFMAIREG